METDLTQLVHNSLTYENLFKLKQQSIYNSNVVCL